MRHDSLDLTDPDDRSGRSLELRDEAPRGARAVVVSRAAAARLSSVQVFEHEAEERDTIHGKERFTFDLPKAMPRLCSGSVVISVPPTIMPTLL